MPAATLPNDLEAEIIRCRENPLYFVWNHCKVKDEGSKQWIPFAMWAAQAAVLQLLWTWRFVILLKARQIGMTTLVVCYAVWLGVFTPNSTILIFSKSQKEAKDMLRRIKNTIRRLPTWLQPKGFVVDASQELELPNGTRYLTFASRGPGGDSYTASLVIIDEADLIPNLNELLEGAEPTIAAEGRLVLLSRVDKKNQDSTFKMMYRSAKKEENEYRHMFIPWNAAPWRTEAWYLAQKRKIEGRTGALDDLYAQYPATDDEALAPREQDKRFPAKMVLPCYQPREQGPLTEAELIAAAAPAPLVRMAHLGLLRVYEVPQPKRTYLVGADVAEGNPNSDDSVACVIERAYQRQVAVLAAKIEPTEHAQWIARLAAWYHGAKVMVERNHSYGESCIAALNAIPPSIAPRPKQLAGRDNKQGWWTDHQGKRQMYAQVAASFRCGSCVIVDRQTYEQIISLDVDQLEAPVGKNDDCAVAFGIAVHACSTPVRQLKMTVLEYDRKAQLEEVAPDQVDDDQAEDLAAAAAAVVDEDDGEGDTVIGCIEVTLFEGYGEWWLRAVAGDAHVDLVGLADRKEAVRAARIADRMVRAGRAELPADEPSATIFRKLVDRGWLLETEVNE